MKNWIHQIRHFLGIFSPVCVSAIFIFLLFFKDEVIFVRVFFAILGGGIMHVMFGFLYFVLYYLVNNIQGKELPFIDKNTNWAEASFVAAILSATMIFWFGSAALNGYKQVKLEDCMSNYYSDNQQDPVEIFHNCILSQ